MDNFTHSLTGWALGQTGLKNKTRKGLAALILGANMPDIDVFFSWVAWEPLATHRGVTHSLVGGVLLLPPVLALLLWLLDRWQVKRGAEFRSGLPMHAGWLVVLSYLGALTHPLLDWQNTYAVQFLSPFSNRWFHNDALFIIDVWLWSGLAFAIWLSRRREKGGQAHWGRPPRVMLALFVAYVTGNSLLTEYAKDAIQPDRPEIVFASPEPVLFYRRNIVWRDEGAIRYGAYNPLHSLLSLESRDAPVPDNMDDPVARTAMTATPEIADFMNWSVLPMAEVTRGECKAEVRFTDARFARRSRPAWMQTEDGENRGSDPFNHVTTVPTGGAECTGAGQR